MGREKAAIGRVGDVPLVVLKRVVQEIGKTDYKVGVITTASQDPELRAKDYHKVFSTLGAS